MILEDVSIVDLKTFPQNLVRVYFLELNKGLKFLAGANRTVDQIVYFTYLL